MIVGLVFLSERYQGNQSGIIWKFSKVNWQILGWPIYRSGWVTFNYKKAVLNISVAIKEFLRIENGSQKL